MATVTKKKSPKKTSKRAAKKPATGAKATGRSGGAISDASVLKATGRGPGEWFKLLDANAKARGGHDHKQAAEHLHEAHGCPEWWCQMITVMYERDRGHRVKHERPDGFSVSASKTVGVPMSTLYGAWSGGRVNAWLEAEPFTVRKATKDRSIRITWADGTNVEVMFYPKGTSKSQVTVQHSKLKSAAAGERMKKYWAGALASMVEAIGG